MSRYINFKERELIELYCKDGKKSRYIALKLGRSEEGIRREILYNGGRENYNAIEAEKNVGKRTQKQREDVKSRFIKRLENLEMQVEILIQTIKEMVKK